MSDIRGLDSSFLDGVRRALREAAARVGLTPARKGLRERHLAQVNARSHISPERRQALMDRAAKDPGSEDALAKGDAVYERYLERLESGAVHDRPRSGREPRA